MSALKQTISDYLSLIRFDKPIGTYLVLWPTLWALWLAAEGVPDTKLIIIFVLGTFLMRSAGCVINDYADRHIDKHIERTANRPITTGRISSRAALVFFVLLCLCAFALVLLTNLKTILLSFGAVALAACYPFMKRYTHLPQLVLGAAFAWSIPMAFAAQTNQLPSQLWLIYIAVVLWTVCYDTFYAMVDRDDDLKVGVKSAAILFGDDDKVIISILQVCVIAVLIMVGQQFQLGFWFYLSLVGASGFFIYQQWLVKGRLRDKCFQAFLNNHWVGLIIFAGIFLHYFFTPEAG
jgi:4-hydroxybenzoate polyprenyltransferase